MSCLDLLRLDMRLLHMHVQAMKMLGNLNPFQLVLIRAVSSHNMEVSQQRKVSFYKFCVSGSFTICTNQISRAIQVA